MPGLPGGPITVRQEARSWFCPVKAYNFWVINSGLPRRICLPQCMWYDDCPMHPDQQVNGPERTVLTLDTSDREAPSVEEDWRMMRLSHTQRDVGDLDRDMAREDYLLTGYERTIDGVLDDEEVVVVAPTDNDEDEEDPGVLGIIDNPHFVSVRTMERAEELLEETEPIVTKEYRKGGRPFSRRLPKSREGKIKEMGRRCACYVTKSSGLIRAKTLTGYGRVLVLNEGSRFATVKDARNGRIWKVPVSKLR
jgi:hypothetical protein